MVIRNRSYMQTLDETGEPIKRRNEGTGRSQRVKRAALPGGSKASFTHRWWFVVGWIGAGAFAARWLARHGIWPL